MIAALGLSGCNPKDARKARNACRALETDLRHDKFQQVLERASKGAATWRDEPQSEAFAHYRILQAEVFLSTGRASQAWELLSRLHPASAALRTRRDVDLGNALIKMDGYAQAQAVLSRAATEARAAELPEILSEVRSLQGVLLARTNQPEQAQSAYREALKIAEQHQDAYHRAIALNNLGTDYLNRSHYDQAVSYFEKARSSLEQIGSPRLTSIALHNLSVCYEHLGDFDKAMQTLLEAISVQERLGANFNLALSYGEAGNLWKEQGDLHKAISYYTRALDLATKQNAPSAAAEWASNLSSAYVDLGDWANADRYNRQARSFRGASSGLALYTELYGAEIAQGRGKSREAERRLEALTHADGAAPELRWTAFSQLGLLRALARDSVKSDEYFERALALVTKARTDLSKTDDRITFLSQAIEVYQDYVDLLIEQGQTEKALLVADSSRAQVLAEDQEKAAQGIREYQAFANNTHAVIVSYWLTPKKSYAWLVTANRTQLIVLPETGSHIAALVKAYREELEHGVRNPLETPESAGWRLSNAIAKPVAELIPAGADVIVIPDGPLHDVSLDTLPLAGDPPQYWIERATLSVAPSLRVLAAASRPANRKGGVLIVGDPDPIAQYTKLSYAAMEIDSLRHRFPSREKRVLVGRQATVEGYRESHPRSFSLIHFTAHAEANHDAPLDSAVILSPSNSVSEEYKLYARDIEPLRADLVTVSACRSAGSRSFSGEGLIGFAWAFLHAGARNVIAGLWDVDDRSTAQLMDRMYAVLEKGKTPAEALHEAKLALLRSGGNLRKPYYWGPFQVYRMAE